ncbi:hypothetical protein HY522_06525 [bacterium]|nr:hypothetical protein [bacterium]
MSRRLAVILPCLALVLPLIASASSTQDMRIEGSFAFLEGKFTGAGLNHLGELGMGYRASHEKSIDEAAYILAAVEHRKKIYLGSGHPAALMAYDGKSVSVVARFPVDVAITALAAADRSIYAAVLPHAVIYKVGEKGDTEVFADFSSAAASPNYIWALETHGNAIYAALGGHFPSVYKIDIKTGKKELLYKVNGKAKNVTALRVADKEIYFGDDAGRVFRQKAGRVGEAEVLYAFSDAEVKAIDFFEEGLAVAVNSRRVAPPPPPPQVKEPGKPPDEGMEEEGDIRFQEPPGADGETEAGMEPARRGNGGKPPPSPPPKSESPGAQGQAFPPTYQDPFGKGEGNLFWMTTDGRRVHRLWFSQNSIVLSILPDKDGVWVATSNPARLYRIGITGAERLFYESSSKDLSAILRIDKSLAAAVSNPAAVFELGGASTAEYLSKVFDAGFPSRLGQPDILGSGDEAVDVLFRSGATADIDSGWSDLKALKGPVPSSSGRFFQVQLLLKSPETALRRVRIPYRVQNLYPRLINLSADLAPAQDGTADGRDVRLQWDVVNLDNDLLEYQISYRPPGSQKYIPVFEPSDLPKNIKTHSIPSASFADGLYRFQVDVTDEPSNGAADALTGSAEFPVVLVDRTPPVTELKQDRKEIRWHAYDAVSRIVRVEYRVDGGPWKSLAPDDGLFDTLHESGRIPAESIPVGSVVDIRAADERDNSRIYTLILK